MADPPIDNSVQKDINSKEAMFKLLGLIFPHHFSIGIDYIKIFEAFQILEQKVGKLPIFFIPDYLPPERQKKLKHYLLTTIVPSPLLFIKSLRTSVSMTEQNNLSPEPRIANSRNGLIKNIQSNIKNRIKLSNKELVNDYLEYFELFYANFIVPIIEKLEPPVSENRFRHSYNFQIKWFESFLKQEGLDRELSFFFRHLDGQLRNALVHKQYYLDDKELYYYQYNPKSKKLDEHILTRRKFIEMVANINGIKVVFGVFVGMRLTNLSVAEYKRRFSEFNIRQQNLKQKNNSVI